MKISKKIFFRNHPKRTAWKNGTESNINVSILRKECPYSSINKLRDCVKRKLYLQKDEFSLTGKVNGGDGTFWDLKYRGGFFGMCHTFHYPDPIGTDITEDLVVIKFDHKLSYYVYIHDPNFFLPTYNPSTFPRELPNIS